MREGRKRMEYTEEGWIRMEDNEERGEENGR